MTPFDELRMAKATHPLTPSGPKGNRGREKFIVGDAKLESSYDINCS